MKKETKAILDTLEVEDVYSMMLFGLFKIGEIPEYSSISELAYLLPGKSLFKLMEFYGGTTIRIPTFAEFKVVINALLLYQYINIQKIPFSKAITLLEESPDLPIPEVKSCYAKIVDILDQYEFPKR